ncbi:MAG: lactoylglutathione lyase [Myxococcales bacterium]|nr:lactoylglutathione lyase [Myxococcales bacterium]
MTFLHTMLRVRDLDAALAFWCTALGFVESRRSRHEAGRFTLVFLRAPGDAAAPERASEPGRASAPEIELTFNWDQTEPYSAGRSFGHVAVGVDDIYAACARLEAHGVPVLRPPRDGRMAFVRSPDEQSVELLQRGPALAPAEPWMSRLNSGVW